MTGQIPPQLVKMKSAIQTLPAYDARVTGVPCSYLTPLINAASDTPGLRYVNAANEGDAVAIAKRTRATVIANFEICNWLQAHGVQTHAQHIGGGFLHPFGYVKLTLALHGSALPDGSYGGNPVGFLLTAEGKKIYCAGDTGLFGDMALIGEEGVELAALPIGDNFTMGPDDALKAVKLLTPKHVIPVHFGTWELIAQDPNAWARRVEAETGAKAHVLKPGGSFTL